MQEEQEVELLEAVGQARQEAARPPGVERRRTGLACACVVGAGDEGTDRAIQLGQRQGRGGAGLPSTRYPGSSGRSSVFSVPNSRSILPRPCGRATPE